MGIQKVLTTQENCLNSFCSDLCVKFSENTYRVYQKLYTLLFTHPLCIVKNYSVSKFRRSIWHFMWNHYLHFFRNSNRFWVVFNKKWHSKFIPLYLSNFWKFNTSFFSGGRQKCLTQKYVQGVLKTSFYAPPVYYKRFFSVKVL